jgi:hypothetical protein
MITLTRVVALLGGLALLAGPAYPQDAARRGEPPAGGGPFGNAGRFGFGRDTIPPPRMMTPPGWQDSKFQKTVDIGNQGSFELRNIFGEVRITGTDGNTVRINATKRVKESNRDAARALMDSIVIRVTERGGGVEVFTENPTGNTTPTLIDYDIVLPNNALVSVRSQGSIFVSNIKGELRAEAYQGHMVLTSVGRVRRAKTYTGNLSIAGVEGDEVTAEAGGALRVRNVHTRTLETRTIAGSTNAVDVDCDRCTMTSTSGDINFTGALRRNGRYDISTNSGNIRLLTDGSSGFDLEAVTGGMFRNDFPLKSTAPASAATSGRIVRGSYGDGGAILSLRSFTGSVTITRPGNPGPGPGGR